MGSEEIKRSGAPFQVDLVAGAMNNHFPVVRRKIGVRPEAVWFFCCELTGLLCVLRRGDGMFDVVGQRTSAALIPESHKDKRTGERWIERRVLGSELNVEDDAARIQM